MAAVGVAAHGVVAVQPSEGPAAAGGLIVPGACVHEDLALQCGTERLGQRVVRAGADRAHGLGHAGLPALGGECLGGADRSVVGVEDGALQAPASSRGLLERLDDHRRARVVAQRLADQAPAVRSR